MSRCMMVTLLAWRAQRFASSKRCTRYLYRSIRLPSFQTCNDTIDTRFGRLLQGQQGRTLPSQARLIAVGKLKVLVRNLAHLSFNVSPAPSFDEADKHERVERTADERVAGPSTFDTCGSRARQSFLVDAGTSSLLLPSAAVQLPRICQSLSIDRGHIPSSARRDEMRRSTSGD